MSNITPVLIALILLLSSGCGEVSRPNIILVIVDTQRADHLGCYGYSRNTSPSIDSLAQTGIRFTNVHTQAPWTLPAVTSIFTGLNVREHGAGRRNDEVYKMNYDIPTIPLLLNRGGYDCAGIFNVYLLSEEFGFNRGFDSFSNEYLGHGRAGESVDEAIGWLSERNSSDPFFLTLHLFDPHDPYDPPPPFDERFTDSGSEGITWWPATANGALDCPEEHLDHLIGLYDGEIAWTDSQLERLFAYLRYAGLDGNTVILYTADHGEEFLEHGGVGHGLTMHREVIRVPLIITGPGIPPDSIDHSLRAHIDILPTVLELASAEMPAHAPGRSLLCPMVLERSIPSSNVNSGFVPPTASITMSNRKLIWNSEDDTASMYDLSSDSLEIEPLSPDEDMMDSVLHYWATPPLMTAEPVDRNMIDSALRDLGYF